MKRLMKIDFEKCCHIWQEKIGARETILGIASFVGADPLCASRTAPTSKDPQAVRKDPEGGQESFASCVFVFFCLNARRRAISKALKTTDSEKSFLIRLRHRHAKEKKQDY